MEHREPELRKDGSLVGTAGVGVEEDGGRQPLGDVLLLPSWHESFGLVALEAMACGVPVIATDRGGTDEFLDDGVNGFLRAPDDHAGIARAALALAADPGLQRHLAEEARRDAAERFGARCVLRQYVDLYDRVLAGASRDSAAG